MTRQAWRSPPAAVAGQCRNCGKPLQGRRTAYCDDLCKELFWARYDWNRLRGMVLRRDNYQCRNCGAEVTDGSERRRGNAQVDHIIPIADGGDPWDIANCRTLCWDCHKKITSAGAQRRARLRKHGRAASGPVVFQETLVTLPLAEPMVPQDGEEEEEV